MPAKVGGSWGPKEKVLAGALLSVVGHLLLGYFTHRSDFSQVLLSFGLLFGGYLLLLHSPLTTRQGLGLGLLFRLLLLLALPALSDDFFRFVWDGRLLLLGLSPYGQLPSSFMDVPGAPLPGLTLELYQQLNSPHYFSVYPPVCQVVFWLAAALSPQSVMGSVLVMRVVLLAAEAGTLLLGLRLLRVLGQPPKRVLWYALNPLVIVELTGNLHFEALMIFFLFGSLYLLLRHRLLASSLVFGLAVGVKLLPLMLLPFLFGRLKVGQFLLYCLGVGVWVGVLFLPFLSWEAIHHLLSSVNLYFQKFEFNASVYYVSRWLGFLIYGYNPIGRLGPLLSLTVLAWVLFLAYRHRKTNWHRLPYLWLLALTLYLLLSTTVHPWYITSLVALALFTPCRFPMVWSGMVVLSYATYRTPVYQENLWLVGVEYAVVLGWLLMEWQWLKEPAKPPLAVTDDHPAGG